MLSQDQLNGLDEKIIEFLEEDGRASPSYFKRAAKVEQSRQYVSSRFVRLAEHGHIEDRHDTGIYDFVEGPVASDNDSATDQ